MTTLREHQGRGGNSSGGTQPLGSVEDMTRSMQGQLTAALSIPRAMLEAQMTMSSELFGFMARRMKAQADLYHELGECRELSETVEAQRKFSERATGDYSQEFSQLATLLTNELKSLSAVTSEAVAEAGKAGKLAA